MTEIIDVITNLQFTAEDEGVKKSAANISRLSKEVEKLSDETKDYQQFLDKNRGKNAQQDKEAIAAIQKNTIAIKEKQKALFVEIEASKKLNTEITKEVGLLASLNAQLDVLKAKKAFATTGAELKAINVDIANVNKQIKGTGEAVGGAATKAFSGLRQLAYLLPGLGLAGIFNLAFEAIGKLFPQIEKYGRALLGLGGAQKDLNDAIKEGLKNSYVEVSNLDRLYNKSQDVTVSIEDRREAVNKLQKLYPAYFANIEDEIILNGGAKNSYDELRQSILATAKAKAIEGKLIKVYNDNFEKETELRRNLAKATAEERRDRGKAIEIELGDIRERGEKNVKIEAEEADRLRTARRRQAQSELFDFESEQADQLKILTDGLDQQEKLISDKTVESNSKEDAARKKREAAAKRAREKAAREQAESDKIILAAQLSLLEEEAREIKERQLKYEEERKKLRRVSAQERKDFEEAYQQDILDIGLKYSVKQLELIDKQLKDINKKVEDDFRDDIKRQQEIDAAKQKAREKELDLIQKNFDAIRKYIKESNEKLSKDEKEALIRNIKDIGQVVQAFGDVLNTVTQASIDNVDAEINAQERRIDRAAKYAERGGAQLLEIEEERLRQLEEKREKFARRQLQINAALALSNAIVAVATTAAESGVASIATIPAVLAAIAAGYAFVNTLQEPQSFAEGTKEVQGAGTETSDSVPANLSRGERVMTAKTSKKFKPILDDIQDGVFADQQALIKSIQSGKYSHGMNYNAVINSSNTNTTSNKEVVYALGQVKEAIEDMPIPVLNADAQGLHTYYMRQQRLISKRNKY